MSVNILALDLGTNTGYAYNSGESFFCGTWKLATPKEVTAWGKIRLTRRCDPRVLKLFNSVRGIIRLIEPKIIIFEDVQFSSTQLQTQMWASLRAAVWCANDSLNGPISPVPAVMECVAVGTLKKFAAGSGNADKEAMMKAVARYNPERFSYGVATKKFLDLNTNLELTDDAADAIHLWRWATQKLTKWI